MHECLNAVLVPPSTQNDLQMLPGLEDNQAEPYPYKKSIHISYVHISYVYLQL